MPVHQKKNITPSKGNGAISNILSPEQLRPENFHQYLRAEIREATRTVMEEILREELCHFLGADWGESTMQAPRLSQWVLHTRSDDEHRPDRRPPCPARPRRAVPHASL